MSQTRKGSPQYFISHLADEDRAPNYLRKEILPPISIELDAPEGGLSGKRTYFDLDCQQVVIEGHPVPEKVIAAAKKLSSGDGGWFDGEGERAGFF